MRDRVLRAPETGRDLGEDNSAGEEEPDLIVQTLTADLDTLKQNIMQKEDVFKAKVKVLLSERKTLQTEKKLSAAVIVRPIVIVLPYTGI
ncbi:hypothetical protein PR003_g32817 [Phytophthora rubi]|uniref:Uncharacterized protein n=3 Tax=Phytophthora TaxID=4783 RepID=A0A6A4B2F8_9STRA|nr:hypothetical protein PF003_g18265 [Phytophthora fragariae]KAE8906834.1 hypothetical protein PF003_g8895 [Phytophthora fragariae]KAE8955141.1 hypothetical protein PR002_g31870 [Phytophthora rubi]KAE9157346.1 hypothetical protein PF004_g32260 [Phytophthora fragariae]KAE9264393.1 hypothetical protein PR003_g32817 [Phytophthora rubi]